MRFDTRIAFVKAASGEYNEETGDWEDEEAIMTYDWADVTQTGEETLRLIYGEIREGVLTVRIQGRHRDPFDYILIGGKKYHVDRRRPLRRMDVFVVSEVQ